MTSLRRLGGLALVSTVALVVAAPMANAGPPPPPKGQLALATDIVVKLNPGYSITNVMTAFPVVVDRALLASRGIYLVRPTDTTIQNDPHKATDLAHQIAGLKSMVAYAETDQAVQLSDTQFHGWPWGAPTNVTSDPAAFYKQPMVGSLGLAAAHASTNGAGVTVAVLDTGADPSQPALAGRLASGWDYVSDDADTNDVATGVDDDNNGIVDAAVGHGTFVSGLVALVAPGATILPYRVLDSDGYGSIYEVAQAILDAVAQGADVINLSFGTATKITSHVLTDAITQAQHAGVLIVGAAGNDGNNQPHFPAAQSGVISTSALSSSGTSLASFSDWGPWAQVAAPGQDVVGPLPGGTYAHWAGTSMAAPLVSGQAALVEAAHPGIHMDKLTQALTNSASALPNHVVKFGSINIPASIAWAASHH